MKHPMTLSEDARGLIRLSLKGVNLEPEVDGPEGMGFSLKYQSGLELVLLLRVVERRQLFRAVPRLYIVVYEQIDGAQPVRHYGDTMTLPKGPTDMKFLMAFTPTIISVTRAIANSRNAGALSSAEAKSPS